MAKSLGDVKIRYANSSEWQDLGKVKALKLIKSNGKFVTIGNPEDIFELDKTESDDQFLKDLKISDSEKD